MTHVNRLRFERATIGLADCMAMAERFEHNPALQEKFLSQAIAYELTLEIITRKYNHANK